MRKFQVCIGDLQRMAGEDKLAKPWCKGLRVPNSRRSLFYGPLWEGDGFYKGSATACGFILPLLFFYRQLLGDKALDHAKDASYLDC